MILLRMLRPNALFEQKLARKIFGNQAASNVLGWGPAARPIRIRIPGGPAWGRLNPILIECCLNAGIDVPLNGWVARDYWLVV